MRKFLIATHGTFASGIKSSLELIVGQLDHVFTVDAYLDEKITLETEIEFVLDQISASDELIVFTDLAGGSVTNRLLQMLPLQSVQILSGVNLPLLLEMILADEDAPVAEIIEIALTKAKEQIMDVKCWMIQNSVDEL